MVFKVFFVISDAYALLFHLLFVLTTLMSLPLGVMFRMLYTKNSATGKHTGEVCQARVDQIEA